MKPHPLARILTLALGVLLALPSSGQAGIGTYFADRWYDFADIFTARVSAARHGRSLGVMVRATTLAQAGVVYFNGEHAGLDRRAFGIWREKRFHWALGPLAWNEIEMRTVKGNDFAQETSEWTRESPRGIIRNGPYYDDGRREPLAIGVEIQPGILAGFELRVAPLEALDFILGWTTMDVYDDDVPPGMDAEAEEEMTSEPLPEEPVSPAPAESPQIELILPEPDGETPAPAADKPAEGDVPLAR